MICSFDLFVAVILEQLDAARVAKLRERLAFDLADALARDAKLTANFLQRAGMAVLKAKAELDDLALAVGKADADRVIEEMQCL